MSACASTLIVLATIMGPITLVFLSVSFGTDHWLEFRVDRSKFSPALRDRSTKDVKLARYTHTRDRGVFRECYPGNDTQFLDNAQADVVDSYCFNIQYNQPDDVTNPSGDYLTRLHLSRCFLAFYILAITLFVLGYVFGLILCCLRVSRWAYVAGLCSYTASFATAAAIAFFHGVEYIERNNLDDPSRPEEQQFYPLWEPEVQANTDRQYGWSYALGWVGMILAALTATLYSLAGCYLTGERYEDKDYLDKSRAGGFADYPMAMEPVYAVGAADPYTGYPYPAAYMGPMAPDMVVQQPYLQPYPALGGEQPKDVWQWREVSG